MHFMNTKFKTLTFSCKIMIIFVSNASSQIEFLSIYGKMKMNVHMSNL